MREIFIGLFVIILLAGIAAKMMKDSKDETSFVGHFFHAVGYKDKEDKQKAQINKIVHQFTLQNKYTSDYLNDQRETLSSSRVLMGSLSQIIQDRLDHDSNMDLLRLKDAMQQFQDKSAILIEHGKQIADLNDQQIKINQEMALEADKASFISNSDRVRFEESIKSTIEQQRSLMDEQQIKVQDLQNTMQQILEQSNQMQSDVMFKQNTELLQKMQAASDKTKSILDKAEEQKRRLEQMNEKNLQTLSEMKEKIENMQQKAFDAAQSRKESPDQTKLLNDRLRDKLDQYKANA